MARLCERPGCSQPAEVAYGIDPEHFTVWIEVLDPALPASPGVLCLRHADAMVVPLRWTLDDRREPVPRLFRSPATADAPLRERLPRSRPAPPAGAQLALEHGDAAPTVEHVEVPDDGDTVDPAAPAAATDDGARQDPPTGAPSTMPWRPEFDPDDDLDGLLSARGPLLSRAFRSRARRPDPAV